MDFTIQVIFTGLGVAVVREPKPGSADPGGVDLLLIDMSQEEDLMKRHLPRLTFQIDDLLKTAQDRYDSPHFAAVGSPQVEIDLIKEDCQLSYTVNGSASASASGGNGAPIPGLLSSQEAVEWIPEVKGALGIDDLVVPNGSLFGTPYIARVRLPPGTLSSRRLLTHPDGALAGFVFGTDTTPHPLAEQLIWTREGVSGVALGGFNRIAPFSLDAELRDQRREPAVIQLAVTNLPAGALPKRFGNPSHFPMYGMCSQAGKTPNDVLPLRGDGVTPSGACPPLRAWSSV
jgi:hypothetical protein